MYIMHFSKLLQGSQRAITKRFASIELTLLLFLLIYNFLSRRDKIIEFCNPNVGVDKVIHLWNFVKLMNNRSSHQRCSLRKGVLRNFAKFTGKQLIFIIKKETLAQVLSWEFCKISKNTFFTEHFWATASKVNHKLQVVSLLRPIALQENLSSNKYQILHFHEYIILNLVYLQTLKSVN